MSVRQKIDQLISDSIEEREDHPPEPREPDLQVTATDVTLQLHELSNQVRELTTQVATLTSIIKRLREE